LTAVASLLPISGMLSQEAVAQASIPRAVCGSWAMLQVSTPAAMRFFTPSINAALAIPGVKGLSLRAPWTSITSSMAIYDAGVQLAQADHRALAIRFLAGVDTPSQDLGNSTALGGKRIPLPWGPGATATRFVPNTVFEGAYRVVVGHLAAYARAHGIHMLHLPWYSGTSAEIYDGIQVQRARGYSLQNFLTGYERLLAIGMSVAGPSLTVEFPMSGIGTRPVVMPLENYMAAHYGSFNPALMVQWNTLTDMLPAPRPPAAGVNVNRQMMGQGDFNWTNVYQTLVAQHAQSVEIYLQSFAPSLAHASLLRQKVASFATTC
jgi:hypothetical protein